MTSIIQNLGQTYLFSDGSISTVNSLLPDSQSRFRKGYNTRYCLDDIMVAMDKRDMATLTGFQ